ncbi:hypothetical protein C5167_031280, partial [Papaver somniferum]
MGLSILVHLNSGKVSRALERNKGKGDQSSSSNVVSAELEEVFGRKQGGGIRGYS